MLTFSEIEKFDIILHFSRRDPNCSAIVTSLVIELIELTVPDKW